MEKIIMKPILVDYDKCNADGICADVCPRKLIAVDAEDSMPRPIPEAVELCISCGHCLAACPTSAITLNEIVPENCPPTNKRLWPDYDQLDQLLKSRRSIRVYKDKPVDSKIIETLLETCRFAPSGSNGQPVNWIIATGSKRLKDLAQLVIDWMIHAVDTKQPIAERLNLDVVVKGWERGEDRIFRGAPMVIMTHALETASLPQESCVIAMTYLDLTAASMGLGACWVGYLMLAATQHAPLKEALGIPQDHRLYGAMVVGYPKYAYRRIPPRNQPRVVVW
jgi:nitroreductase/NAD-dependent dihydropyrimidine dehydrogenase PreA subunit